MSNLTPEAARAASYLATRERLDFRGKGPKCNPPNRQCGDRCIPPNWKCRVKGEGTDSHSRVVAGDPLAGAAAIQRGQARLRKGFKSGNLADIQGGRAAIERGIVKAVPGQNIKQKQALRKSLNKVLLPAATAVFGVWALQRGHQGLKLIPQYRNGAGRQIEESVSNGISWGLDRLPVLGPQRLEQRRRAGLEAQRLGRAVARSITRNPGQPANNSQYYRLLSRKNRGSFTGLDTAIQGVYGKYKGGNGKYENFRSDMMAELIGAKGPDGKSLYAEAAAANYLARQFSIDPSKLINSNGVESRFHTENQINSAFLMARSTMRSDMEMRGLDPRNTNDVERYVTVALGGAKPWVAGLPEADQRNATERLSGYVRDLVARGKTLKDEKTTRQKASELFNDAEKQFDKYFNEFSQTVRENTAPTTRVIASGNAGNAVRTALIGAADRVKRDVGLEAGYRVMGANHAELILQKVYFEKAQPGSYNGRARSTWLAGDSDIRYAAQDMGWEGRNLDDAVEFLRANGFARLERRPASPARPAPSAASARTAGQPRSARRRLRSRSELIRTLTQGGLSPEAAAAEADRIISRRGDEDDISPELVRTATYLAARTDFKEGKRLGKPCGASHIPKAHECRKGQGATAPESATSNLGNKIAVAAVVGAVGAVAVTVAMDARRFYNSNDLPNPPSYREVIRAAQAGNPKISYDIAIGKHYDKVVESEGWKPGQLVYTRYGTSSTQKDPTAHFAVYMGKSGDAHQFADFGVANTAARQGEINLYAYGPGNKGVAPFVFVKAPPIKGDAQPYDPEAIQQRVYASLGAKLKYDALDNNCETWARMITSGVPRSVQTERLTALTRALYRRYDRRVAGASPSDIPSVKQQARILDYQSRMASGDKSARSELKTFQALIAQGKRTDALEKGRIDLPDPRQLLRAASSDLEALLRTKFYLMLLVRTLEAPPTSGRR